MHKNYKIKISIRKAWLKKPMLSGAYRQWLTEENSLTMRLQQRFSDFNVRLIQVSFAKAFLDEIQLLASPVNKQTLIREVCLIGDQQAMVFAHSVIPKKSLDGPWRHLKQLGNQPLGATLFTNPKIRRDALQYKKLNINDALYQQTNKLLRLIYADQAKAKYLWARRSIFRYNRNQMLVTEVFLPAIIASNTR